MNERAAYIHGTDPVEQARLAALNRLTNPPFLAFLALRETDIVLEVGSGLGLLAREAAGRTPRGMVVGLEYAAEQIAAAPRGAPNLRFVRGDAHRLSFPDDTFDVAYCRYVLEHVADPLRVLREMRRVLKPGGRALAQENDNAQHRLDPDGPAFDAVWRQFNRMQADLGGDAFIGRRLYRLFRAAGFRDIELSLQPEVHHAGQPSFPVWIENLVGNIESGAAQLQARGLATAAEIGRAVAELRALLTRDDATSLFYWNRAQGVK